MSGSRAQLLRFARGCCHGSAASNPKSSAERTLARVASGSSDGRHHRSAVPAPETPLTDKCWRTTHPEWRAVYFQSHDSRRCHRPVAKLTREVNARATAHRHTSCAGATRPGISLQRRLLRFGLHPGTGLLRRRQPHPADRRIAVRQEGFVDHIYNDHVSILKFIERNWSLPSISPRSRYRPQNGPAIGDLMNLFAFP